MKKPENNFSMIAVIQGNPEKKITVNAIIWSCKNHSCIENIKNPKLAAEKNWAIQKKLKI